MIGTPTPIPMPMGRLMFAFLLGCVEGVGEVEVTAGAGDDNTTDVLLATMEEVLTIEELRAVLLAVLPELFVISGSIVVKMVAGARLKTCAGSEQLQPLKP